MRARLAVHMNARLPRSRLARRSGDARHQNLTCHWLQSLDFSSANHTKLSHAPNSTRSNQQGSRLLQPASGRLIDSDASQYLTSSLRQHVAHQYDDDDDEEDSLPDARSPKPIKSPTRAAPKIVRVLYDCQSSLIFNHQGYPVLPSIGGAKRDKTRGSVTQ